MGVYIKGMEMPKNCGECFACKAELSQEKKVIYVCCFTREEYVSDENRVETDCPLIHVPPHGRLIEKNAVFELIRSFPNVDRQLPVEFMKALYELPTIIPAEEVKP